MAIKLNQNIFDILPSRKRGAVDKSITNFKVLEKLDPKFATETFGQAKWVSGFWCYLYF